MGRIFVADGTTPPARGSAGNGARLQAQREGKRDAIEAYLYAGAVYVGWGSDPAETPQARTTGFFYDIPEHPGFGPDQTLARLASGLHFGHRV